MQFCHSDTRWRPINAKAEAGLNFNKAKTNVWF